MLTSWSIIPPIVPVVAGQKWQTQSSGPESSGVPWTRPEPSTGNAVTAFIPLCFLLVIFSRYGCTASSPLALHTLLLWDVLCNCTSSTLRKKQFSGGIFFLMWTHMSMCVYVPGCPWLNKLMQLLSFGPRCLRVSVEPVTSCPLFFKMWVVCLISPSISPIQ